MYRLRAEVLRDAAEKRGDRTGYAISKRTGLAESTVSRLLNGRVQPGANTLLRLAETYGISTDDLMESAEPAGAVA